MDNGKQRKIKGMGKIGKTGILGKSEIRVHREGVNTENNETYENWEYREYMKQWSYQLDTMSSIEQGTQDNRGIDGVLTLTRWEY